MKAVRGKFFLHAAKQVAFLALIVIILGQWQSRDLPSGKAPVAVMSNLSGHKAEIPDQKPGTVSVLYFFAPWCGVCRISMRHLGKIPGWFPGLDVKAVALDFESPDDVRAFDGDVHVRVPIYLGTNSVREMWHVSAYPTYVVIGADNEIYGASVGYSTELGMILRVLWAKIMS